MMRIITDREALRRDLRGVREKGARIGLVPTMGALHAGHMALIRRAKEASDFVVVSIFVNPDQFGPNEDFAQYPRPFEKDCACCASMGVDVVFSPEAESIVMPGGTMAVVESRLSVPLCGKFRPGHFSGVLSVVAKLFNIIGPDIAVFGQKDAQQVRLIEALVAEMCYDIAILIEPTVRESDGLALSSRNAYLSEKDRHRALCLSGALFAVRDVFDSGERDVQKLRQQFEKALGRTPGLAVEYADILDYGSLTATDSVTSKTLVAVAARIGKTRLIDNIILTP